MKKKVYISFDYDYDLELKSNLVAQSLSSKSNFEVVDMSIKYSITSKWKKYARKKIKACDFMLVICGLNTHNAKGVNAEITLARETNTIYYLIDGRKGKGTLPKGITNFDQLYRWSWKNLESIFKGEL